MTSPILTSTRMSCELTPGLEGVAADSLWAQWEHCSSDAGFSHWGYCAAPTCPNAAPVLLVTTYPRGHLERCAERQLCPSALVHPYSGQQQTRPVSFKAVREAALKRRELSAQTVNHQKFVELLEINRQFGVTRGVLIPLTGYLGAKGLLALAFDGTDTQLQHLWQERSSTLLQRANFFHGEILRRHFHRLAVDAVPQPTARQRQLLQQLALGNTTAQIARSMHISIHTVNKHVTAIKRRFGARNAAHAAVLALQWGLLS